jgi:hypothetical protein
VRHRHSRVEVRSGYRPERRRNRVGKERNRDISAGQPFPHDAGSDDGREKKGRSNSLGGKTPLQVHRRPFSSWQQHSG